MTLAVIGANGLAVAQKNGFIRVGDFPSIGFLVGNLPAGVSDNAVADFLGSLGFEVVLYDDAPANRPPASQLGSTGDVRPLPLVLQQQPHGEL